MAQVVDHLPSKCEILSSNLCTYKKKKTTDTSCALSHSCKVYIDYILRIVMLPYKI
jgi:hypothetical protein